MLLRWMRRALVGAGRWASPRQLVIADAGIGFLALGRWLERRHFPTGPVVATREELFALVIPSFRHGRPLYVEFGVHEGASIQWWSDSVDNPQARFVGFDSFEGLPEHWKEDAPRGHFSTDGAEPIVDDGRVSFVKGWFEVTLPGWTEPPHDRLFANIDVDLYSSAASVLRRLAPLLVPGSFLYLDELADRHHELKAFDEFLDENGVRLEVVGLTATYTQWLFRIL